MTELGLVAERFMRERGIVTDAELASRMQELGFDCGSDEVEAAIEDIAVSPSAGLLAALAEILDPDDDEWEELVRAARIDAEWRLTCHREGWAYW